MQLLAKLSLFFNKTFALWVIVVGALAYAFPSTFKPLGAYIAAWYRDVRHGADSYGL